MEWIGYIATLLTIISFIPKDQFWLRVINAVGSIVWVVYGIGTNTGPVILVNVIVLAVHMWWFFKSQKNITFDTSYIEPDKRKTTEYEKGWMDGYDEGLYDNHYK